MVVSLICALQLLRCLWEAEEAPAHMSKEASETRKLVVTGSLPVLLLALVSLGWIGEPQAHRDREVSQAGPHFFFKLADNQRT